MSEKCCSVISSSTDNPRLKRILWFVFILNFGMFFLELTLGYLYKSTALMADSLDMLSDAFVYGVSILVLMRCGHVKAKVSLIKGVVMTVMALYVAYELFSRTLNPTEPDGQIIASIGILALVVNAICFWLLSKYKEGDINLRSAWICSRNDMLANLGVIAAGLLVLYSGNQWPDFVIGAVIAALVLISSFRVMTDSMKELKQPNN